MSVPQPEGGWHVTAFTHPGEMLLEEFMKPMGLSANRLADALKVPVSRLQDIIHQRRGVTADTACRLALYFGNTAEFWISLQTNHELAEARKKLKAISKQIKPMTKAS